MNGSNTKPYCIKDYLKINCLFSCFTSQTIITKSNPDIIDILIGEIAQQQITVSSKHSIARPVNVRR